MPEGDTIHRIAAALQRELEGGTLDRVFVRDRGDVAELAGRRVERVHALGKHLLIEIEGGWTLRVHLGMHGKVVRRHARQRPPRAPTVVLESGDRAFDCVRAYTAELVRTAALATHGKLARLGPDLLAESPDIDEAVRRASLGAYAGREIGELLLDQRVAAGIGNVWKSEVLFACRVHPRARVGALGQGTLRELFETAARLMGANLATRRRESVPLRRRPEPGSVRLWVYGRAGKGCMECGGVIERFLQGEMGRSTYWCRGCQGDVSPGGSAG
jgi:endonuclease VIII